MKKSKLGCTIGLIALSAILSGCGTGVFEMTPDEESLIIQYAAYVVGKYNVYQKDGVSNVIEEETEDKESQRPDDTQQPDNTEEPDSTEKPDGSENPDADKPSGVTLTMEEALGLPEGITITYTGHSVKEFIMQGNGYSADAGLGYVFYIMEFSMKNTTEADIAVDTLSKNLVFKLTEGEIKTVTKMTALDGELITLKQNVAAGESMDTMLLFKVKAEDAESIKNPLLQLLIDGKTSDIEL